MFNELILNPILNAITNHASNHAFCINGNFYTYKQFGEKISTIRQALTLTSHSSIVALVANDDIETYASIIALWLEGLCYVPIHPNQPLERNLDIIQQVNASLIMDSNNESLYRHLPVLSTSTLRFEKEMMEFDQNVQDDDLAYILFTSGSTGKPKGVQISRGNIAAFADSFSKTGINIEEHDRCLQCFDLTFDVSVQSFLIPLTKAACVYTVPVGHIKYQYVGQLIDGEKITFGAMAPSMLRYLKPYFEEIDASHLRQCILTAEASPLSLIEAWWECAKNTEIYDFYGPTEATIYCTFYKLQKGGKNKTLNGLVSIGKPLANCQAIIIDEDFKIVPQGEKGELCIAGDQLSKGYWNNDLKNQSSFFEKTMNDGTTRRFYRTGDLCYQDEDGDIMYAGRIDFQAKIQGFRVELGEIEYAAAQYLNGASLAAVAFENNNGLTEIGMAIEKITFDKKELLHFLQSKLPDYMIPSKIITIQEMPLNTNGKIDRNALKKIF